MLELTPEQGLVAQIRKNDPRISEFKAIKLAQAFERVSSKHGINAGKVAAIAMQESAYRLNAKACFTLNGRSSCDICMMQINDRTADAFGFDQERLLTDLDYCIEAGVLVLKDFKRMYSKREDSWWTRYNASSPEKREIYQARVARYF